jgi:hypothetical protein
MTRPTEHNFTLVEVVVAMAVMLMVAMIIGSAGKIFHDGYNRAVRATDRLREYMAIDRIWDGAVRNAVPFKWTDEEGESRFVFEGEPDTLMFTALRRADGETPGALIFIRLRLEEEELVAYYSYYPRPPWDDEYDEDPESFTREVIATNIASISFQYAEESDSDEAETEWFDIWEEDEHEAIPLAIRMTVEWKNGRKEYWLRRTAGSSLHSSFGYRTAPTAATD